MPDTDDTKKVPSQKYKTPFHQYKIQWDTKLTVQDASSSIQDTRDYQVNSTRSNFISTRNNGISSQQYKTPVLQYKIQGATKPTVQEASSSIQDTRGYQANRTRRQFFNTRYKGLPRQQDKTPVLQYQTQGDTKPTGQDASSSVPDTRGYQANSTRHKFCAQLKTTWELATQMPTMSVYPANNVKNSKETRSIESSAVLICCKLSSAYCYILNIQFCP